MKLSELEKCTDANSWLELRWLRFHGWYDTIAQLEAEVDLWQERTSIKRGEWSICIPHNSAYRSDEGCIRCENARLEDEVKRLRGITIEAYMRLHGDALKEVGPILLRDRVTTSVVANDGPEK